MNQITRQMIWIGLMAIVVVGLAANATIQNTAPVFGQEGGTTTPTPTSVPDSDEDSVKETVTREDCEEDVLTGKLTCTETTEPLPEDSEGGVSGQGGSGGILSPYVTISGLVSTLEDGDRDSFEVNGFNLQGSRSYKLRVSRPSGNSDIGFNSSCTTRRSTVTVPAGRTRFSYEFTLYGCDTDGGAVLAELLEGSTLHDSRSQSVTVVDPQITISGLVSSMDEDDSDSFTVSASSLVSSNTYNIRITASDSDMGFNSSCSDRQKDITVTANSTSYTSSSITMYGCESDGATVTASLRRGSTTVATTSQSVTVEADDTSSGPDVTISAPPSSVTEGQSIKFTVTASPAPSSDLPVKVEVTQSGSFIDGTPPTSVTIRANQTTASFTVQTDDDDEDESDGSITARILSGTGYDVGKSASDTVSVQDNDEPAPPDPASIWYTTLTSEFDGRYESGYYAGYIGSLSDQTFEYNGTIYTVQYIEWYQPNNQLEFGLDRCLKASDFVSLSIDSTPYSGPNSSRSSDAQCDANGALRQWFKFNNVTENPLTAPGDYHIRLTLAGPITQTATVEADTREPFVGQSVTMRASTSAAFGTASSHQWQEWSGTQWTDLSSATSSSHVITSSASDVRTFRVMVTNASSMTENSYPVSIQWRPMVVTVTASPDYPESGNVSKRVVTLTANANAPTGVTYQWQQGSGNSWTNLGTKSTSATRDVSFTTRGTRKFRVQLSHSVVPSVESEPIYVAWDEFAIVTDLLNALHASTTSDTTYTKAQTALLSCMNGGVAGASSVPTPSFTSFSGILHSYVGTVKNKMESTCRSDATRMFNTNQSVATSTLASLKRSNTEYADWLETPQGRAFDDGLADPDIIKLVSYLGAYVADPGSLRLPVYDPKSPSGRKTSTFTLSDLAQGRGLKCLPDDIVGKDLTLDNKLRVLNCLVFATPHSFWVRGSGTRPAETLKDLIDNPVARYAWLDYGDWECTYSPDGPLPSCLKHDVAYGGLQKFGGLDAAALPTAEPDGTELDEAWNPRNKALADYKFRADISRHGCQDRTIIAIAICRFPSSWIAQVPYFEAVAKFNSKGWAVSTHDVSDFEANPSFINCAQPVVPRAINVANVTRVGDTLSTAWNWERGCVDADVTDVAFYVEWDIRTHPYYITHVVASGDCTVSGSRWSCEHEFSNFAGTITGVSIYATPRDWEYGGHGYGGTDRTGRRFTSSAGPFEFHLD